MGRRYCKCKFYVILVGSIWWHGACGFEGWRWTVAKSTGRRAGRLNIFKKSKMIIVVVITDLPG